MRTSLLHPGDAATKSWASGASDTSAKSTLDSPLNLEACHIANAIPNSQQACLLLALPPEFCSYIYTFLPFRSNRTSPLLQTCHHTDAAIVLGLPMSFSSQAKLYAWLSTASDSDIKRLRDLTLRLTDIDLTPLFENHHPSSPSSSRRESRQSAWSLYQQDLEKLDRAMKSLTGLAELTIIPPEQGTALVRGMYLTALGIVANRCKGLRCLTVRDREDVREKVPGLGKLGKVVFEGPEVKKPVKREAVGVVVKVEADEDDW
jgi:hypothetical protein